MAIYSPAFETQRDDGAPTPWTNCNPASVAMLIDWYTFGRVNVSDVDIRRASGVPLTQGMNFAQIDAAIRAMRLSVGGLLYSEYDPGAGNANISWGQLLTHLRGGGGAVVCGNYGAAGFRNSKGWGAWTSSTGLRINRWQPGGTFGHAVYVGQAGQDDVLLMDPLGHGDYRGDRIPIAALWDFIWKTGWADANVRIVAAHWFTAARPSMPTEPVPAPPTLEQRLAIKDARFDAAGRRVRELESAVGADITAFEQALVEMKADHAARIEALRKELRAGRRA